MKRKSISILGKEEKKTTDVLNIPHSKLDKLRRASIQIGKAARGGLTT
jgi:hypothetical protein